MKVELAGLVVGLVILAPLIGAPCAFAAGVCGFALVRVVTFTAHGRWFV